MKRKNILLTLGLAATLGIALVGCGKNLSKLNGLTFEESYNESVLSGIGLLDSSSSVVSLMSQNEEEKDTNKKDNSANGLDKLTDEFKNDVLENLKIAKNTINGLGDISKVKDSDKEGYKFMYTITQRELGGGELVYTFYYNENETDEEDEKNLDGIVLVNDLEYKVSGEKEIEGDEIEQKFKVMLDEANYVIIETEISEEETEYKYQKYLNNKLAYETEVEYEIDENGEIELSFEATLDGKEIEYSFEFKEENNISFIDVEIESDGIEKEVVIKVSTDESGNEVYEFVSYKEEIDD